MTANSYHQYFNKVLKKRLKFVKNIALLASIGISITLSIPYDNFRWNLALIVVRAPVLCLASLLIQQSRTKFSTVEYTKYKTLSEQIVRSLVSTSYAQVALFYTISALFVHLIFILQLPLQSQYYLLSKEYRQKPLVNDEWIYFWISPVILGSLYGAIHLIFQRNLLPFKYGLNRCSPDEKLLTRLPRLLINSSLMTFFTVIASPLIYCTIKPMIYRALIVAMYLSGLDTSIPPSKFSVTILFNMAFVTFHTVLLWEIINHAFNVYATIGCLDGKKSISAYSSDPIGTLLTGLKNAHPDFQMSRLSAFQELAYISTAKDPEGVKLRSAIYNARFKNGVLWSAILKECSLVINETAARINYRSPKDLKALQDAVKSQGKFTGEKENSNIFGNSSFSSHDTPNEEKFKDAQETVSYKKIGKLQQFIELQIFTPVKSIGRTLLEVSLPSSVALTKRTSILNDLNVFVSEAQKKFLSSKVGVIFRVTLKRDTESRVLNPVNYGNAVIALSNLLLHSLDEDKNFFILNDSNLREILELLEVPIRASSNYSDFLPHSVFVPQDKEGNKLIINDHLITLIHDMTMNEFYKICIKFNYKLNDLILNARTFKLAKWVVDVAIAQQQQSHRKGKI